MPKVSEEHRASRRDQILRAALSCFARQGFRATSMADIITESGLSAGAIYLYYSGKSEIAAAVARRTMEARGADILALASEEPVPSPADLIGRMAQAFSNDDITPGIVIQLWGEAITAPEFAEIVTGAFRGLQATLAEYLARWAEQEQVVPASEIPVWAARMTPIVASLLQGYFLQSTLIPGFDIAAYLDAVDRLFA